VPTLHLRHVPAELLARLRAGAREREIPIDQHAIDTLQRGVDSHEARVRGGVAVSARLTDDERQERARKAARARWAKRTAPDHG
jgi:hypothetical protein